MEIHPAGSVGGAAPASPSSTTSSSSSAVTNLSTNLSSHHRRHLVPITSPAESNPGQSWWESISKARSRIHSLSSILPSSSPDAPISSLADSDRPARALLDSVEAYQAVASALSSPASGSGEDPLCQWLYETYQSSDPDLRLVVLSFVPLLAGLYLSRVIAGSTHSLAGFEAVLLSLYSAEAKARNGKPVPVSIADLSQPSLYHAPRPSPSSSSSSSRTPPPAVHHHQPLVGVLCPPLEPQVAVKSTKRAFIVGVVLDCYYRKISLMPACSKLDFCEFATSWAGQDCPCRHELDQDANSNSSSSSTVSSEIRICSDGEEELVNGVKDFGKLTLGESPGRFCESSNGDMVVAIFRGCRIPLPWELLQPVLRILGHCLLGPLNSQEIKDAASVATRAIYARASHELVPQAILASRSLIRLDNSSRLVAKTAIAAPGTSTSNPNTPTKPRKPEILLASK